MLLSLLVVNADDFGRLEGDAFKVKHKVLPVSPRSEDDFETVLQARSRSMDLIAWLEDLAIEPSEMTTRRHLRSLERWPPNPMQWEQLSDEAVLRFGRFPTISELHENRRWTAAQV